MTDMVCAEAVDFGSQRAQEKRPMLMEVEGLKMFEGKPAVTCEEAREDSGLRLKTCASVLSLNYLLYLKPILNFFRPVTSVRPGSAPEAEWILSNCR